MNEPRIQYTTTSDGVSIAYATFGEGRPFIVLQPPGFSHAELTWQMFGAINEALAASFHVVYYDSRGTGLSDRSAVDFSMDAMIRDLEAVVERCGFESLVLGALATAAPIGVTYAATHPERVSHLILIDGFASFSDFSESPAYKVGVALLDADWVLFTETFANVLWWSGDAEFGRQYAEFVRACCEPEAMRAAWESWKTRDVAGLLPGVTAPTLVIQNKNNRWIPTAAGQRLAAAIPGARLALIDDMTYAPVPNLVEEFVFDGESGLPTTRMAERASAPQGMTAIFFADIVDSTVLTEHLGDGAFRAKARDLDASLRTIIRDHGGVCIDAKTLGDGVLATFVSASKAIQAALACGQAGNEVGLPLHLGLHAGDVIREENNVFGGAVNIAARISGLSTAGEVLVSGTVRDLARTSAGVVFEDRGEQQLKGVAEPVRVFRVV